VLPYLTEKIWPDTYRQRLRLMADHCRAKALITFAPYRKTLTEVLNGTDCRVLSSDDLQKAMSDSKDADPANHSSGKQTAVLQFSSGTTGIQKAVTFSHQAILSQTDAMRRVCRFSEHDVFVTWAPLYHDMGLVAAVMLSMVIRARLVLISPFAWVRSPRLLLEAIDAFRGTVSFMPNFAFNHCVNGIRARDLEGLDLSCCRFLVNGAEPVMPESLQRFADKFGPYGFQPSALGAAYGATENSSSVTITPVGRPPIIDWVDLNKLQHKQQAVPVESGSSGSIAIASCGCPIPGIELKIVDDRGRELPDRWVGEITTRSKTMMGSYFRRPDLTAKAFRNGWYHSGDLGYITDGQLYLCGRKSDVIIIGGKNIYPHDVEQIVDKMPEIKPGRVVAFGMADQHMGTEKLVIVAELKASLSKERQKKLKLEIRRNVLQTMGITVADLDLVNGRWVPKSTSGKIARAASREKFRQILRDAP
jgi:acyl-CoA synthetase (AMP-forming)/AMP-acid ligase II